MKKEIEQLKTTIKRLHNQNIVDLLIIQNHLLTRNNLKIDRLWFAKEKELLD